MKKNLHITSIVLLVTFFNISLFAQKFVKATGTAGSGASWDSPLIGFTGLRTACQAGGTVYIAAGNYTIPGSLTFIQLAMATHTIQGGFPANSTGTNISNYNPNTNVTTIDGNNNQIFIVSNIVNSSITVNLKGLTLSNAVDNVGDNLSSVFLSDTAVGGPESANYSFTDLTITNNRFAFDITGLNNPASKVLFKNCYFSNNVSIGAADCIEINNFGTPSTAASSFMLDSCTFVGNHAMNFAEVHVDNSYGVTFQKTNFCNNNTTSFGGCGICAESSNKLLISYCNFRSNGTATNNYGALCFFGNSPTIVVDNCIFFGNYISGNNMTAQNSDIKAFNTGYTLSNSSVQGVASYYSNFTVRTNNIYSSTSDPGTCPTAVILPITGLVLTGQLINGLPLLKWATLTEQNSNYFNIQSSTTGSNFTNIGKVDAAGNSNSVLNYSFTDNAPTANIVYYRLAIVDKDGATSYSNTVAVKTNGLTIAGFNIYPNPVSNRVNIETGVAGVYKLELFNTSGQRVQYNQITSASSLLSLDINRSIVSSGMYILKVTNADGSFWNRTILIK